jgi:hypothetical protein
MTQTRHFFDPLLISAVCGFVLLFIIEEIVIDYQHVCDHGFIDILRPYRYRWME